MHIQLDDDRLYVFRNQMRRKNKKYIATQFVNKTYLFCFIVRLFRYSLNIVVFIYSFVHTPEMWRKRRVLNDFRVLCGISSSKIVPVVRRLTGKPDEKTFK